MLTENKLIQQALDKIRLRRYGKKSTAEQRFWLAKGLFNAENLKSRTFVEIGIDVGNTALLMTSILDQLYETFLYIGVDKHEPHRRRFNKKLRRFVKQGKAICIIEDSITFGKNFTEPVAWVFIDGCHCFYHCYSDIYHWRHKIEPGGYLFIHDIYSKQTKNIDLSTDYHVAGQIGVAAAVNISNLGRDFRVINVCKDGSGLLVLQKK